MSASRKVQKILNPVDSEEIMRPSSVTVAKKRKKSRKNMTAAAYGEMDRREVETGEEESLMSWLSDDDLLNLMKLFSAREQLTALAFICRRWCRLASRFAVYELVPRPFSEGYVPWGKVSRKKFLELAATHSSIIRRINFIGLRRLKTQDIVNLCQRLPKLQDLSVSFPVRVSKADYKSVLAQLPRGLLKFDLVMDDSPLYVRGSWNDQEYANLFKDGDDILKDLYGRCPSLQYLNLHLNSPISPNGFDGLLQTCKSLTSLHLCSPLLTWTEIKNVFSSCKYIRHFSLISPALVIARDSREVRMSFSRSPMIIRNDVNSGESAETMPTIFLPEHLISFRIYSSRHSAVSFQYFPVLHMIVTGGHQLQQLHAHGVFNTSWHHISVNCPNLKLLDLSYMRPDHKLSANEETVLRHLIESLKKLECIALPSCNDRILVHISVHCPNIKEIRFQGLGARTRLNQYPGVTDGGVVPVAENCLNLRVLTLSGCPQVTQASTRALAFHCRKLEVLLLSDCLKLRDEGILNLLPRLHKSLKFLDVVGCRITASTLQAVRTYARESSLNVVAIDKALWRASTNIIGDIRNNNPNLEVRNGSGIWWHGYHGEHSSFDRLTELP